MLNWKYLIVVLVFASALGVGALISFREDLSFEVEKIGIIEGSLSYPSEGIPEDVEACAENIESFEKYCTNEHLERDKYKYGVGYEVRVPAGSYEVYAYRPQIPDYRAYFTKEEEKELVEIRGGQRISGVDLLGWEKTQEEIDFSRTGNLMKNNPGLEKDVWYLSYEEPGSPALSVKLSFESGECITSEGISCEKYFEDEPIGERVRVEGFREGDTVEVKTIQLIEVNNSEEGLREKARSWIENNSPTYKFDGSDLVFSETRGLDLVGCENCYEVEFNFTSSHAGYGDREGEILAQVITPHTIVLLIEDGEITKAVTDGKFNEMSGEFLE